MLIPVEQRRYSENLKKMTAGAAPFIDQPWLLHQYQGGYSDARPRECMNGHWPEAVRNRYWIYVSVGKAGYFMR